jgi:hypothetical protein
VFQDDSAGKNILVAGQDSIDGLLDQIFGHALGFLEQVWCHLEQWRCKEVGWKMVDGMSLVVVVVMCCWPCQLVCESKRLSRLHSHSPIQFHPLSSFILPVREHRVLRSLETIQLYPAKFSPVIHHHKPHHSSAASYAGPTTVNTHN